MNVLVSSSCPSAHMNGAWIHMAATSLTMLRLKQNDDKSKKSHDTRSSCHRRAYDLQTENTASNVTGEKLIKNTLMLSVIVKLLPSERSETLCVKLFALS